MKVWHLVMKTSMSVWSFKGQEVENFKSFIETRCLRVNYSTVWWFTQRTEFKACEICCRTEVLRTEFRASCEALIRSDKRNTYFSFVYSSCDVFYWVNNFLRPCILLCNVFLLKISCWDKIIQTFLYRFVAFITMYNDKCEKTQITFP